MTKKRVVIHIIVPIILAIMTNFICLKLFYIPDPTKPRAAVWATYAIAVGVSLFVLGVSTIVSAILYVGRKRKE